MTVVDPPCSALTGEPEFGDKADPTVYVNVVPPDVAMVNGPLYPVGVAPEIVTELPLANPCATEVVAVAVVVLALALIVPVAFPCADGSVYVKVLVPVEVIPNVPLNAAGDAPLMVTCCPLV